MSFSVFEKIDPSCQNGSMEKAKNLPYHQRPYASIAERTLVDISIYSPRPQIAGTGHSHSKISIHSPRMGRDHYRRQQTMFLDNFNPLSPHGERRGIRRGESHRRRISIHSPRMGRDRSRCTWRWPPRNFNPLSPHGERRMLSSIVSLPGQFQSTLPAWGETARARAPPCPDAISIHSPRMGRDIPNSPPVFAVTDFNPLSPHGERRAKLFAKVTTLAFQSTLPAWGETCYRRAIDALPPFQSTLPAWGETEPEGATDVVLEISIHSPRMGRD